MYMNYITTTQLRTKSTELVNALSKGDSVSLVHRSRVIGKVVPDNNREIKTINVKRLEYKINKLSLPKLSLKEIDRRYRIAMEKKHGKGLY